jgi:predicted ATPase
MINEITHISKVEIKKLWGYEDLNFEWHLNPDVNILAGGNGSGKSTVLSLILGLLIGKTAKLDKAGLIDYAKVLFNNLKYIEFYAIRGTIEELEQKAVDDDKVKKFLVEFKKRGNKDIIDRIEGFFGGVFAYEGWGKDFTEISQYINVAFINTFDQELKDRESIEKLSDNQVKTELDWQIYHLQNQYKDYQINIGKRAIEALTQGTNGLKEIDAKKNLFLDTIDILFSDTNKRIDRTKNEIMFIGRENKVITSYQLSSGEKQMLIILLTALVQDNKPSVMIIDEPEISLHTDWQEQLIDNIRNLNPNAQIIIATHSPFIVSKGWASEKYVFQMDKIRKDKLV